MSDLLTEVGRFQEWAGQHSPVPRSGEWEFYYPNWGDLYQAVFEFVAGKPFPTWSPEEVGAVLYALARDNESEHIAEELCSLYPELLMPLTQAALQFDDPQARWQLAEALGWLKSDIVEQERLLLTLARDDDEYVRRRSLQSLTRLGSSSVEALALEAWNRPDPHQQWSRMMVLSCLSQLGSPQLEPLLSEAEQDNRQYLRECAEKIRRVRSNLIDPTVALHG